MEHHRLDEEERLDEERMNGDPMDQDRMDEERRADDRRDDLPDEGPDEEQAGSPEAGKATSTAVLAGADEQGTAPEDRDAAAAAEGRTMSGTATAPSNGSDRFELYSGADVEDYRRRWDTLQAGFVDDPRAAAEQADALIHEVVDRISQRFRGLQDELGQRHGGDGGNGGDTESMRLAIRQYRAFFRALVRE